MTNKQIIKRIEKYDRGLMDTRFDNEDWQYRILASDAIKMIKEIILETTDKVMKETEHALGVVDADRLFPDEEKQKANEIELP